MSEPTKTPTCGLCGFPMPKGEEMFRYHGYSGPCPEPLPKEPPKTVPLRCLECNTLRYYAEDSPQARGEFNVFCPDKNCEDRYAARL